MSDYSIYPDALDGYSQLPIAIDSVTEVDAKSINRLRSAIVNIESELGVLPSGSFADITSRFESIDSALDEFVGQTLSSVYQGGNSIELSSEYGDLQVSGTEAVQISVSKNISLTSLLEVSLSGSTAMGVKVSGLRNMGTGTSAEPPALTTGTYSSGDQYFHSSGSASFLTYYDSTRTKWLSGESIYIYFGRNGATANGQYYRGSDGLLMSASSGIILPFNGTIVSFGYTRTDTDSSVFGIAENGTVVSTVSSAAISGTSLDLDVNVTAGNVISVKNNGPNDTSDATGWVRIKFRG